MGDTPTGDVQDSMPLKKVRKKVATSSSDEQHSEAAGSQAAEASALVPGHSGLKPRRKRITPEQLRFLTASFEMIDTPSFATRERLAEQTQMTNREVQIWHQNRRQKRARAAAKKGQAATAEDATVQPSGLPMPRPGSSWSRASSSTASSAVLDAPVVAESPIAETAFSPLPLPSNSRGLLPAFTLPPIPTVMGDVRDRTRSAPLAASDGLSYFLPRPDLPKPSTNHLGLFDEMRPRLPLPTPPLPVQWEDGGIFGKPPD